MMGFYARIEKVLFCGDIDIKLALFDDFYDDFAAGALKGDSAHYQPPLAHTQPSYASFASIVHPTKIKRPKHPQTPKALATIIHQIAHIEYSAIDLALDAAYRFRQLPSEYRAQWVDVAREECEHFGLLRGCLRELGYEYGDFAVHTNLYDAMVLTSHSALERMGLVHRAMEASGLDANPFVVQKLCHSANPIAPKLREALGVILRDEIGHVSMGDAWFRYLGGDERCFARLLRDFARIAPLPRVLNESARIQAGYTQSELDALKASFHS